MTQATIPAPTPRELFGPAMADCARIWREKINERLRPLRLSQATWLTLWNLSWFPEGLIQNDLAERLGVEGPTLVRLLDRLESEGLVKREGLPRDRRCKRVMLTDAALPIIAEVKSIIAELRAEVLAAITDEELEQALRLFSLIRERLAAT